MKVIVGMSGGVDSSVAALLLKQAGHDVIGLFMKNWDEEPCPADADYADVVRVCQQLDIPHYSVNFTQEYYDRVFQRCLDGFAAGETPNPDILCNQEIKFALFFEKALSLGGDALATGHYCQTENGQLLTGADPNKDQSYFLYTLRSDVLQRVLFPIGHLPKPAVRALAHQHNLPTASKKDSTGICFIGKRPFKPFLSQYLKPSPGPMELPCGTHVGTHDGLPFYTLGQRKGLAIGGAGSAYYVVAKDQARNALIVAQGDDHPLLYTQTVTARATTWVSTPPPERCTARVRYRQTATPCTVLSLDPLTVQFDTPQKAVTPGQSLVLYDGPLCLGGGIIC
jgi:tRNA-uridine 2-sulfurtransferase